MQLVRGKKELIKIHFKCVWLVTNGTKNRQIERVCIRCGYLQRRSRTSPGWTEHDLNESAKRSFEVQSLVEQGKWDNSMLKPSDHVYTDANFKALVLTLVLGPFSIVVLSILSYSGIISWSSGGSGEVAAFLFVAALIFFAICMMGLGSAMTGQGAFNEDIL